jgi:hypothetical protein
MAHTLTILTAESATGESGGLNPWAVGIAILLVLLVLLLAVVSFGGGREHS